MSEFMKWAEIVQFGSRGNMIACKIHKSEALKWDTLGAINPVMIL